MKDYRRAPLKVYQLSREYETAEAKRRLEQHRLKNRRTNILRKKRNTALARLAPLRSALDVPIIVLMLKYRREVKTLNEFIRKTQEESAKAELAKLGLINLKNPKDFSWYHVALRMKKLLGATVSKNINLSNGKVIKKGTVLPDFRAQGYWASWTPKIRRLAMAAKRERAQKKLRG